MSLPLILPTGAMASGDYVDYMIDYLNNALDIETGQIKYYMGDSTIDDWQVQWNRTIVDVSSNVTTLEDDVNKLIPKVQMVKDALSRM